jgi:hypothetical protein
MHSDNSGHTFSNGLHIMHSLPFRNFVWPCKFVYCRVKPVPTFPDYFSFAWWNIPLWARTSSLSRVQGHTQTHDTWWTPLWEWSFRRRDLYLTTHNTHKTDIQSSSPPAGFKPAIPASERPQTHALGHAATGIGVQILRCRKLYLQYRPTYIYCITYWQTPGLRLLSARYQTTRRGLLLWWRFGWSKCFDF